MWALEGSRSCAADAFRAAGVFFQVVAPGVWGKNLMELARYREDSEIQCWEAAFAGSLAMKI